MLEALGAEDPDERRDAAELLVRAYRAPVLDFLRQRWSLGDADAEDLTQEFFATALEKRWLDRFDPDKGRFRTFLRVCADRFVSNQRQAARRMKRGGGTVELSLEDVAPVAAEDQALDARFRAQWVRSVLALALDLLRQEAAERDRAAHVAIFEAYDLADLPDERRPTYASLAAEHALTETQVLNHLAWARRRFRSHVLSVLRRLAGSDAEYREDVRDLLGIEAP
jgi:RNA polymerase sigma-70 factor (ECF subfamily)